MRLSIDAVRSFHARHRVFLIIMSFAVTVRVITTLGFHWAIWFSDSYDYLDVAMRPRPDPVRTFGYPFLLMILRPFHSVGLVIVVQHLMGLALGVILYGLLRRQHLFGGARALPGWVAALVTIPVLLDANQIELEHLLLSDTLFALLLVGAVALMLWNPVISLRAAAGAGLLLAAAAVTRTVALPLFAVLVVFLLIRRVNWRVLLATLAATVLPLVAYGAWYASVNGVFQLSGTDGVFLYSRTMTFADCKYFVDELSAEQLPLCESPDRPPAKRPVSHFYVWEQPQLFFYTGGGTQFAPYKNDLARDFAKKAIMAQPGDYASTVAKDFRRTFQWGRPVYPDPKTYAQYVFPRDDIAYRPGREALVARYDAMPRATTVVEPFAGFMRGYQQVVRLPGTLLGIVLLAGFAGIMRRWRQFGGVALLPWGIAMTMLIVPPATVLFDYRYVLPAVPFALLAAAIAARDLLTWIQIRRAPVPDLVEKLEEPELAAAS
ncbi:MAG: hypothetical protein ABIS86_04740 [Streptosporangiaceae bacterium]